MHQDVPDHLRHGLKLVIVGINPGLRSGATGHHYAFPGNHFWPLLYESGLLPERLTFAEDARTQEFGIGLTNFCDRTTHEASELTRDELEQGAAALLAKLLEYRPRVVCFNGMGIYEAFLAHLNGGLSIRNGTGPAKPRRKRIKPGLQEERLGETLLFVVPSSSGRTAAYPRQAKLGFLRQLKQLVDSLPVEAQA